jgi:hypothetical protein
MFYAKGVNCCAEVRAILDATPFCTAAPDACAGECATLPLVFADVPVPGYPGGLADYICTAFPDDGVPSDTVVVALISLAIALPVGIFVSSAFELANDSEAPESWLAWRGVARLLLGGANAHRRWHWTGAAGPPSRFVAWRCRSADAPSVEILINLWLLLKAWATGTQPPWVEEAEEAAAHSKAEAARGGGNDDGAQAPPSEVSSSSSGASSSAELLAKKRAYTVLGLGAVAACWAIFVWFIFTYGMLIYRLLGSETEAAFARSWGVSYGFNALSEWREVAKEALKGALILVILESLYLTRNVHWLEVRAQMRCCRRQQTCVLASPPRALLADSC